MVPKNLQEFIEPMLALARSRFPLVCPSCRRRYADFEQFARETTPIATTLDYPFDPLGMISWVRCGCGNTLTLRCEESSGADHRRFAEALKGESKARGRPLEELMSEIRDEVRRRAA